MSKNFDDAWDDIHATFDTKRQETRARAFARVLVHARDAEHKAEIKRLVDAVRWFKYHLDDLYKVEEALSALQGFPHYAEHAATLAAYEKAPDAGAGDKATG